MTIHVLKTWGGPGQNATTRCRLTGRQSLNDPQEFRGVVVFRAVRPDDTKQGGTCKDCALVAHAKKTDKQNMRIL